MPDKFVIVAGGGIGGLATALTLHQIGVPCVVYEAVREMRPLGVGINLQPNAVRELYDLGITQNDLDRIGLPAKEWALVGLNGNDIYSEVRGRDAGYHWPQYAVHRGQLHMLLYDKLVERIGRDAVKLGSRVTGYAKNAGWRHGFHRTCRWHDIADRRRAADRRRRHPLRDPRADASRAAADPLGRRHHVARHHLGKADPLRRFLCRPRHASPAHGVLSDLAARSEDRPVDDQLDRRGDAGQLPRAGNRAAGFARCRFPTSCSTSTDWLWDWFDAPAFITQAGTAFENPMIDRDPVATWQDGPVALMGDAAHAMYPTGSNGGSQADCRCARTGRGDGRAWRYAGGARGLQ